MVVSLIAPSVAGGSYRYSSSQNVTNDDSAPFQRGVVERVNGSGGAVGVTAYDTLTGTCSSGPQYLNRRSHRELQRRPEWARSRRIHDHADPFGDTSSCTVILGYKNPTGSWTADSTNQTKIITITDAGGGSGNYRYSGSQNVTNNDSAPFQRGAVERLNGTTGAVGITLYDTLSGSCVSGTHYQAISDRTVTYGDGQSGQEAGVYTITPNAGAITSSCTIILGFKNPTGQWTPNATNQTKIITITDAGGGGGSFTQTFYVDPVSGSDSDSGLTTASRGRRATGQQRLVGVRRQLIGLMSGNHVSRDIDPASGGVSASRRIVYCAIGGDVEIRGPASGTVAYAATLDVPWVQIDGPDVASTPPAIGSRSTVNTRPSGAAPR